MSKQKLVNTDEYKIVNVGMPIPAGDENFRHAPGGGGGCRREDTRNHGVSRRK